MKWRRIIGKSIKIMDTGKDELDILIIHLELHKKDKRNEADSTLDQRIRIIAMVGDP